MKESLASRWNRQDVFLLPAKIRKNKSKCKLLREKIISSSFFLLISSFLFIFLFFFPSILFFFTSFLLHFSSFFLLFVLSTAENGGDIALLW